MAAPHFPILPFPLLSTALSTATPMSRLLHPLRASRESVPRSPWSISKQSKSPSRLSLPTATRRISMFSARRPSVMSSLAPSACRRVLGTWLTPTSTAGMGPRSAGPVHRPTLWPTTAALAAARFTTTAAPILRPTSIALSGACLPAPWCRALGRWCKTTPAARSTRSSST